MTSSLRDASTELGCADWGSYSTLHPSEPVKLAVACSGGVVGGGLQTNPPGQVRLSSGAARTTTAIAITTDAANTATNRPMTRPRRDERRASAAPCGWNWGAAPGEGGGGGTASGGEGAAAAGGGGGAAGPAAAGGGGGAAAAGAAAAGAAAPERLTDLGRRRH